MQEHPAHETTMHTGPIQHVDIETEIEKLCPLIC